MGAVRLRPRNIWADPDVSAVLKASAGVHFAWLVIKGLALAFTLMAML